MIDLGMKFFLFKLFKVPVYFHWSAIFLFWILSSVGLLACISIFLCLLAHEFGHVLMAKYYGIKTDKVIVFGLGAAALLETNLAFFGKKEAAVALAGPMVNVVLALLLLPLFYFFPTIAYFETVLIANVAFAIFNLLPLFPMDGGRIIRGLLSHNGNIEKTTKYCAISTTLLVVALIPISIFHFNLMHILILLFLLVMAWSEYFQIQKELA